MNKEAEAARADEYSIGPKPPSSFTDSTDEVSVDHVGHSQTIGPIGPSVGDNYDNEYYDDPYYNDPFYDDDYEANDLQTSNAVPGSLESDTYHQQTAVTIGPSLLLSNRHCKITELKTMSKNIHESLLRKKKQNSILISHNTKMWTMIVTIMTSLEI